MRIFSGAVGHTSSPLEVSGEIEMCFEAQTKWSGLTSRKRKRRRSVRRLRFRLVERAHCLRLFEFAASGLEPLTKGFARRFLLLTALAKCLCFLGFCASGIAERRNLILRPNSAISSAKGARALFVFGEWFASTGRSARQFRRKMAQIGTMV
jgi:hypothetical protein